MWLLAMLLWQRDLLWCQRKTGGRCAVTLMSSNGVSLLIARMTSLANSSPFHWGFLQWMTLSTTAHFHSWNLSWTSWLYTVCVCMCLSVSCSPLHVMCDGSFWVFLFCVFLNLSLSLLLPLSSTVTLGLRWSCTQIFHGGSYKHKDTHEWDTCTETHTQRHTNRESLTVLLSLSSYFSFRFLLFH